ncbi:MAG: hypothetical protein F6K41_43380, partial [Symploca sp. SIO3E6]|nr:hypothetical protein [Caldora sp. SIO3E6]
MLHISLDGRDVGAYVLTKENKTDRFCFVFGFDCRGIHTTLRQDQLNAIFNNLEAGLKDLPPNEQITFHLGSFTSDQARQQQLKSLLEGAPSPESQFLVMAERSRIQELTRQGIRKPKSLRLYVTYTIEPDAAGAESWIEKVLAKGESWWYQSKNPTTEQTQLKLKDTVTKAFKDGFQKWEQVLSNKMGLDVKPLTVEELWSSLWKRFNSTQPPDIPQKLLLNQRGLQEQIDSELHSTTLLLESDVPVAD